MDIINVPLGYLLKFCNWLTGNYALALLLFAIAMQLILLPFGIKQQKNSVKQASLRPKEMAIRKKYAGRNDKVTQQKMQNEIMDLYQKEHYSPFGGCLPLLIQMPILFALFAVVTNPLTYISNYTPSEIGGMKDAIYEELSESPDVLTELNVKLPETKEDFHRITNEIQIVQYSKKLGIEKFEVGEKEIYLEGLNFNLAGDFMDLSKTPNFSMFGSNDGWLLLIPLFTLIFTYGSQIITKKFTYQPNAEAQENTSMKVMLLAMPLISVYFTFQLSAAVGLYWIYRNILSTVQQIALSKAIPIPRFSEEDYKAAEREMNVKPAKKERKEKVRSLHRIDEEDDEEVKAEEKKENKPALKEGIDEKNAPKLKDESDRKVKENKEEKDEE